MYYVIGASISPLHRESTDSLIGEREGEREKRERRGRRKRKKLQMAENGMYTSERNLLLLRLHHLLPG